MSDHDYKLRVLIVDDDEDVRDPLAEWLEVVEGMEVQTAEDDESALRLVKQDDGQYDVVLLDKVLGEQNGIDVMRRILAEFPDLPVIMFTGQDHAAGAEAKEAGAYDYLLKPFDDEDLVDLIREAAEQSISAQNAFLYQTAEGLCESLNVPVCIAWLLDRVKGRFKIEAWAGDVDQEYRESVYIDWEKATPRRFPGRGRSVYFPDLRKEEVAESLQHWDEMIEQGWISLLSTPMVMEGRTIGIIDVYTLEERAFTKEERERLGDEAAKAAMSVRNAQLAERSRALLDITQVITSSVAIKEGELFELILERGLEFVGTDIGWLYLVDRATNSLRIESSRGIEEEEAGIIRKVGEGITGWVAEHGIPQNVPDVGKDHRYFHARGPKVRSEIVVPLKYGEGVIGVLTAKSPFLDAFSADDMSLLSTFASQAAIALENIRQHRELSVLYDTSKDIAGEQDLGDVLDKTVRYATELLDAKGAGAYLPVRGKEEIELAVIYGLRKALQGIRLAFGEGMAGKVFLSGKPMKTPDSRQSRPDYSRWLERAPIFDTDDFTAVVEVPLIAGKRTLGVLFVADDVERRVFTKKDERLLERLANQVAIALRNTSRIDELEVLNEIGREVSAELNYRKLLDLILNKAQVIVPFEHGNISLIDKRLDRLVVESTNLDGIDRLRTRVGEGVTGWVAKYGESLRVDDVKSSIMVSEVPEQPEYLEFTEETRSELCVPLRVHNEVLGVINVESPKLAAFDEEDQRQLETLASQAAIAIYNARLLRDRKLQANRHNELSLIGARLSAMTEENEILQAVADFARGILNCDHCSVFSLDREGDELAIEAVQGSRAQSLLPGRTFELGQGIAGWVAENKKPALIPNTSVDDRFEPGWSAPQDDPKSLVVVPIMIKGGVYGVISAEQDGVEAFDGLDLQLLETLALQTGQAVQIARLINRLQTLNEFGQQLSAQRDVLGIYKTIVDAVFSTLDCAHCTTFVLDGDELVPCESLTPLGEHEDVEINRRFKLGESIAQWVAETGVSVFTPDAKTDARFSKGERRPNVDGSMIVAPIKLGEEVISVISADQDRINAFDERDLEMVETLAAQAAIAIANKRLEHSLEKLVHVGHNLASISTNLDETLEAIVEGGRDVSKCDIAVLFPYDEEEGIFRLDQASSDGLPEDIPLGIPEGKKAVKTGGEISGRVLRQGILVVEDTNDTDRYPFLRRDLDSFLHRAGVCSFIGVALQTSGVNNGVLFLDFKDPHRFTEEERRIAELLSAQAAIALENAQRYEHIKENLEKSIQRLEVLSEMGRTVSSKGVEGILKMIYELTGELMDVRNIQIAFHDEETDVVEFPFACVNGKRVPVGVGIFAPRKQGKDRYGLTEYVIDKGAAVSKGNIKKWTEERGIELSEKLGTKSWIGAPLEVGERVIGLISIQNLEEEDVYDEDDLQDLKTIASQAAVAIENARLLKREKAWSGQLEALQEVGVKIASQLEVDELLSSITERVSDVMSADFSTLFTYNHELGEFEDGVRRGKIASPPSVPSQTGYSAQIARSQESVFVPDTDEQTSFTPPSVECKTVKSFAGIPLIFGGDTVGLLYVNYIDNHNFSEHEKRLIQLLANQSAVAIENARLYEQLAEKIERLKGAQTRIRQMERVRVMAELAADFVHRVNNMAGTIPIRVQRIKEELEADYSKALEIVEPHLLGIREDVSELLGASTRLREAVESPPEPQLVDVVDLIEPIIRQQRLRTPGTVRIEGEIPSDLPPVLAVPVELEEAFRDVITNAVEAVETKGEVLVSACSCADESEKHWLEIRIRDDGPGIPQEKLLTIFDDFFTTKEDGLGYGLWRTKSTIETAGGEIEVFSVQGEGTVFLIRLPVHDET
jgi:GAF domain-containing protein